MHNQGGKKCERCGEIVDCNVTDITECKCNAIILSDAERKKIDKQFTDCLCLKCLIEIRIQFDIGKFAV